MRSVLPERRHVNGHDLIEGAIAEAHRHMLAQIGQGIGERLSVAAEYVLGRAPYVRRGHVSYSLEQSRACPQCHAVQSQRFSRNGSRMRHLLTRWGEVPLRWPRFVCACGGSITLDLDDWLTPYQRIGSDVDAQIQRWGALSVSLRAMQDELAHSYMGVLGQRTLLQRLHQLQQLTPGADERPTPPIVQFDAIWFTQLCATGQWRTDRKGPPPAGQKPPQTLSLDCVRRLAGNRAPGSPGLAPGRQRGHRKLVDLLEPTGRTGPTRRNRLGTDHSRWREWLVRRLDHDPL